MWSTTIVARKGNEDEAVAREKRLVTLELEDMVRERKGKERASEFIYINDLVQQKLLLGVNLYY